MRLLSATAALMFTTACDSCLPEGFRATPKAGFERMAAERLRVCVQGNPCSSIRQCFVESEAYCLDAGYSKTCGQMEPEGSCGSVLR